MRLRRDFENHYCTSCRATWKHENSGEVTTCLRCGVSKPLVKTVTARNFPHSEGEDHNDKGARAPVN